MLTAKQYVEKNGVICPVCLSSRICSEHVELDGSCQLPTTESRGLASDFKASKVIDCTSLSRKIV